MLKILIALAFIEILAIVWYLDIDIWNLNKLWITLLVKNFILYFNNFILLILDNYIKNSLEDEKYLTFIFICVTFVLLNKISRYW